MKKWICAVLAICMLCGAMALVGCRKGKGNNGNSNSRPNSSSTEVGVPVPPEWDV